MSFNLRNIVNHPNSTLLALAIFVAVMVPVFLGQARFSEVSPVLIVLIPLLLYGKDNNGRPPSNGHLGTNSFSKKPPFGGVAFLFFMLVFSSCITRQKCLDKFGSLSEVLTQTDTLRLISPPDTIQKSLPIDNFLAAFRSINNDTLINSEQAKAKLQVVYVPKIREVQVTAECLPDTIDHYITRTITKELVPKPWDYTQLYARKLRGGLLWIGLFVLIIYLLFKIFR